MFKPGEFGAYGQTMFTNSRYKVKERSDMAALLPLNFAPKSIAELGCADGTNLLYFGNFFQLSSHELTGVDIVAYQDAEEHRFMFQHSSVEEWLLSSKKQFDLILLSDVLEHIYNPWKLLTELRHRLSASGRILISVPNFQNVTYLKAMISGRFFYQSTGLFDQTHIRFFSANTLRDYLVESGYVVERIGYRPDFSYATLRANLLSKLQLDSHVPFSLGDFSVRVDVSNIDALLGQQVLICASRA